jgi:putative addiction module CopG family antidote
MTVELTPEVEAMIQDELASGRFQDMSDVIATAMHALADRRDLEHDYPVPPMTLAEFQAAIDEGVESADNEPLVTPEEARASLARVRQGLARA